MEKFFKFVIFVIAIFTTALGISIATSAELGTSPVSSLPYVLSFITPLSFGAATFLINTTFVIAEKLILKKEFQNIQYFQIVIGFLFGFFIDLGMHIVQPYKTDIYTNQVVMVILGTIVLAFGVFLELKANLMYVPGEGIVRAITQKTKSDFGKNKLIFDVSLCLGAIFLSLIFLHTIQGLREGTIISAFLTGIFVAMFNKIFKIKQSA